jgi:sulfite exporter TauE/SafE
MTPLVAGVVLGLAGGAHCAGMCGPFLAVVAPRGSRAVLHHAARAITYVLLGLAGGTVGLAMVTIGAGKAVAWIAAAGLLLQAVRSTRNHGGPKAGVGRLLQAAAAAVAASSRAHPMTGALLMGTVNGLLPCGLVYSAAISASGWGDPVAGALFMVGFAAGTTALLLASGIIWSWVARRLPGVAQKLAPIALVLIALLLVLRSVATSVPQHMH